MNFRHKIETILHNGQRTALSKIYVIDEVTIGQSRNCQIQLKDPAVAIRHARLFLEGVRCIIQCEDGAPSIRVNKWKRKRATLSVGDTVQIGNTKFTVFLDKSFWGFTELRDEREVLDAKAMVAKAMRSLDLRFFFPSYLTLSLLAFSLVLLFAVVDPVTGHAPRRWSSGPLSNAHKMFSDNCEACHNKTFEPVSDKACTACHELSAHAPSTTIQKAHLSGAKESCLDCHMEHNGKAHTNRSDNLCASCHAREEFDLNGKHLKNVSSFENHPQFTVLTDSEPGMELRRKPIDPKSPPKYISTLQFSHNKHLTNELRTRTGKKKLACDSCHQLREGKRIYEPINYERNCQECHALTFDDELKDKEVPHANPDIVYRYLYSEYAKLLLTHPDAPEISDRFKPGGEISRDEDRQFVETSVESRSRDAEKLVFAATGCRLCHSVTELAWANRTESNYQVKPANPPGQWMPAALFDHGLHTLIQCAECHGALKASTDASDINLPSVEVCQKCHSSISDALAKNNRVETSCVSCHSYHHPLQILDSKKRLVDKIRSLNK